MNFWSRVFIAVSLSLFVGVSLGEVCAAEESSEVDYYKKACDLKYQFGCEALVRLKTSQQ